MTNYSKAFLACVYNLITSDGKVPKNCCIVKKHTDKLLKQGDFSFPLDDQIWGKFRKVADKNVRDLIDDNLIEKLKQCEIKISHTAILNDRCLLFLNRVQCFRFVLTSIERNPETFGRIVDGSRKRIVLTVDPNIDKETCFVTQHRLDLIRIALVNLSNYLNVEIVNKLDNIPHVYLTTNSNFKSTSTNDKHILCGIVFDSKSKKLSNMTRDEYISKRSIDMQLMAQHKYGLRVKNERVLIDLVKQLGNAAVTVDLLDVKHSTPVGLGQSSSKGASFILYNSARLETLFRTFDDRIRTGQYPPLPPIEDVDFSLLKEEEEWQIFFNFILEFPNLIERSMVDLENGNISINLITSFLNSLVGLFSVYYRRCRILTDNRPQLVFVMIARIYLIKCLRVVFNKTLGLINIKPVNFM